jgi:hypothetical protein
MSYSQHDFYSDDPIEDSSSPAKKKFSSILALLFLVVGGTYLTQTTLAANISLNSGTSVQFGQGVAATTACSGATNLTITPNSTFTNVSGGGAHYFSSVTVSNIPANCNGKDFKISAYGTSSSAALAIFNSTSTTAVVYSNAGTFELGAGTTTGASLTSGSGTFTLTFTTPIATSGSVFKITLQSSEHVVGVSSYGPTRGIQFVPISGIKLSPGLNETNDFTIEGWIRSSDWTQANALLPYVGNDCNAAVISNDSNTTWRVNKSCAGLNITYTLPGSATMPNNQWLFWSYVKDSNGQAMFIDGVKLTSSASGLSFTSTSDLGTIGEWYAYDTANWSSRNGIIGEMRISNIARVASTASSYNPAYASSGKPTAQLTSDANTRMLLIPPLSGSSFTDSSGIQTLTVVTSISGAGTPVPPVVVSVP